MGIVTGSQTAAVDELVEIRLHATYNNLRYKFTLAYTCEIYLKSYRCIIYLKLYNFKYIMQRYDFKHILQMYNVNI